MKWATRAKCHVDRTACAWLIRRYLDRDAVFEFVDDPSDLPPDATAFDIPGQPLSHQQGDCTFEVMVRRYALTDRGLAELGRVIHEADIEDERFDAPEAAGLAAIVSGMGELMDDDRLLAATAPLYDGLLARFRTTTADAV